MYSALVRENDVATDDANGIGGRSEQSLASTVESTRDRAVVLTCQPLTDRMLLHSAWLRQLAADKEPIVWVTSLNDAKKRETWKHAPSTLEAFPEVKPFREGYNYLRRFNEFVWDFHLLPPSRMSMLKHVRHRKHRKLKRILFHLARLAATLRLALPIEITLEKLLIRPQRSREAAARLADLKPSVVVTTDPFCYLEPAIIGEAKRLGIKTLAVVTSWDNLSTKNRMVFQYDGYILWSEQMRKDLHRFYPQTLKVPSYVVGAPQFDTFFQDRFMRSREEFCRTRGLQADRPIVVYALGSPNFLKELNGAVEFAKRLAASELKHVQLVVRPHPMFFNGTELEAFRGLKNVTVQASGDGLPLVNQVQNETEILDWVNTFRHADVVVNLSSTVAIEAAILDRPVVNLDFDPEPGQPNQALVKDVNHEWTHFKPIAESGALWLVNDQAELFEAVKTYLAKPELHREERRWVAEYVCGTVDGQSGERTAKAIADFMEQHSSR